MHPEMSRLSIGDKSQTHITTAEDLERQRIKQERLQESESIYQLTKTVYPLENQKIYQKSAKAK